MKCQHAPVGEQQIGEAKQREQLCLVLRQPAVAGLAMPEQVLDHVEGMLDLCPDARFELLEPIPQPAQLIRWRRLAYAALHRHQPFNGLALVLGTFLKALVARIAKHSALLAVFFVEGGAAISVASTIVPSSDKPKH